ncbi:unnamed protein product [Protopolystoma xenopodis]|uniref:DEPDC5 C-terminal domain-containing protein n=1 Tax=Protopolystoma xenopodis TaxID=117903 RepID=A0A448X4T9_9PLAT|nr:unnamed protein product [Protopolystoma xenopodis]
MPRLSQWHSRATKAGFNFYPAPCYPFGYSNGHVSDDPLRAPIFIPLHLADLARLRQNFQSPMLNESEKELTTSKSSTDFTAKRGIYCAADLAAQLFPSLESNFQILALRLFQDGILKK